MSLAHIEATDPQFGVAAREGWEWWVLDYRVRRLYGDDILKLLSGVRNINLAREENEVQIMLAIFNKAVASPPEAVDWKGILDSVLLTKPRCADTVPSIVRFVRLFAGGSKSNFMNDFVSFHSMYVDNARFISASFLDGLCSVVLKPKGGAEVKAAILRFAILKAQYSCPPNKVLRSECQYISQADLLALGKKNLEQSIIADGLLAKARSLVIDGGKSIGEHDRVRLFGKLDCAVVRFLTGKEKGTAKTHSCLQEILVEFYDEFESVAGVSGNNPWEEYRPKAASSSAPVPFRLEDTMQTFTANGEFVPIDAAKILKDLKFDRGHTVAAKNNPDTKFTIMRLGDPVIVREGLHDVTEDEPQNYGDADQSEKGVKSMI